MTHPTPSIVNTFDNIILVCPVYNTGGPEAIHQLSYAISDNGVKCTIAYVGQDSRFALEGGNLHITPPSQNLCLNIFSQYQPKPAVGVFTPSLTTLIVFPEVMAHHALRLPQFSTAVWWLSVDNAFHSESPLNDPSALNALFASKRVVHFAQCEYCCSFLRKNESSSSYLLTDYIDRRYIQNIDRHRLYNKVLFNPRKGAGLSKSFFEANPDIQSLPLHNFSKEQLIQLYAEHTIYIEFGHNPGKDRMPREAAAGGCVVFFNRVGSARYFEDRPIDDFFIFSEEDARSGTLSEKIKAVSTDPKTFYEAQQRYRRIISEEKIVFESQVRSIFGARISKFSGKTSDSSKKIHIHLAAMAPRFMEVRTTLPLQKLSETLGVQVSISNQGVELPRLPSEQPKVLIIQRIYVSDSDSYKIALKSIIERGWIVVTEFDDHPELVNAVHGRLSTEAMWHPIRLAHAVQTATPALADAFRPLNSKVALFPNAAFRLGSLPGHRRLGETLRIFYGALNRERFSSRIGAALADLAARRPDLQFVVVHDRAFFDALGPANKAFHPAMLYEQYLAMMESCDIALMPLEGGPGEAFKSDVKFVEASSLGLATLASPPVYGGTILDGVTGVIVPDVDGWAPALESLVFDRDRLFQIASAAYTYVRDQRQFSAQVTHRLAWYRHLWDERFALTRALSARFGAV